MDSNGKTEMALATATALLLTSAGCASTAATDAGARWERVKFHDLDVDTMEGVQKLYGRIHTAAEHVCSESDPILRLAVNACINKAERAAVEKLNLSQLTAYYKNKSIPSDHSNPRVASR